jgi:hypothetical protein
MWLCLNDAFLSIVHKDCKDDELLVRARRPGDIEKVFGNRVKATKTTNADYRYRLVVKRADVERKLASQINSISYKNFKDSVKDKKLHDAYLRVWGVMMGLQE